MNNLEIIQSAVLSTPQFDDGNLRFNFSSLNGILIYPDEDGSTYIANIGDTIIEFDDFAAALDFICAEVRRY